MTHPFKQNIKIATKYYIAIAIIFFGGLINSYNIASAEDLPLELEVVAGKNPERVATLLKNGADIEARNEVGYTLLHTAASHSNAEIIAVLIEHGADINIKTSKTDATPLFLAAGYNNDPKVISILAANGADINTKDNNVGLTPLHFAAMRNTPEVVYELIKHGADVRAIAKDGKMTVLDAVVFFNRDPDKDLIRKIIEHELDKQ